MAGMCANGDLFVGELRKKINAILMSTLISCANALFDNLNIPQYHYDHKSLIRSSFSRLIRLNFERGNLYPESARS